MKKLNFNGLKAKGKDMLFQFRSNWSKGQNGRILPFSEYVGYSVSGMGSQFIQLVISFTGAGILTVMYNIQVVHATLITVIVAFLNLVIQPFFGKLLDNTNTKKYGKFKPFFIVLTPLIVLIMLAFSLAPQFDSRTARTIYAYCTGLPLVLVGNMWINLFNTYPVAMTPKSNERTQMLSVAGLISSLVPTVTNVVTGFLISSFGENQMFKVYRFLGIVSLIFAAVSVLCLIFFTKERFLVVKDRKKKIKFSYGIREVFKNKHYIIWLLINILGVFKLLIGGNMAYVQWYRFASVWGDGAKIAGALSLITGFGATPAMLLMPYFAKKFGKKKVLVTISGVLSVYMLIIGLIGFDNIGIGIPSIIIFSVLQFLITFNAGVTIVASPSIDQEIKDYQQYISGERLEGFMGTFSSWINVVTVSLSLVPAFIQAKIGFEPGEKDGPFQSNLAYLPENMAIIMNWLNVVLWISIATSILYTILLALFFKLDEKEHERVMQIVKERSEEVVLEK